MALLAHLLGSGLKPCHEVALPKKGMQVHLEKQLSL